MRGSFLYKSLPTGCLPLMTRDSYLSRKPASSLGGFIEILDLYSFSPKKVVPKALVNNHGTPQEKMIQIPLPPAWGTFNLKPLTSRIPRTKSKGIIANIYRTLTTSQTYARSFTCIVSYDTTSNSQALLCARYYSLTFLYMRK